MSPYIYIAISAICSIGAQLILKHGMSLLAQPDGRSPLLRMATSPWVVGGLFFYGCGVIFWTLALSALPLTLVYPFSSIAYIGVTVGAYFFFKESLTRTRIIGIVVIIVGLFIISQS